MKTTLPGRGQDPLDHLILLTTKMFPYKKLPKGSKSSFESRFHLSSWDVAYSISPPGSRPHWIFLLKTSSFSICSPHLSPARVHL